MKKSENQTIPANLKADLNDVSSRRFKRVDKILLDESAKFHIDVNPFNNDVNIQVFSKYGTLNLIIPEGDSANEN